ncbi:MAG: tetratricopeptide repeat protein [Methanothrix sp.]
MVLERQGELVESIESYDRAIQIDSEKPKIWNNRGAALGKMGRYDEALISIDRSLALRSDNAGYKHDLRCIFISLGRSPPPSPSPAAPG